MALFELLKTLMQHNDRKEVLLPAYHCLSIVDACRWAGLHVRFYNVGPNLVPDASHIASLISSQTCAAVFIHYFGFPNSIQSAVEICKHHNISVIEDAAHVDVMRAESAGGVGLHGDWVIGSMRKFYPIYDGACVYPCSRKAAKLQLNEPSGSLIAEARSIQFALNNLRWRGRSTFTYQTHEQKQEGEERPTGTGAYQDCRFNVSDNVGMTRTSRVLLSRMSFREDWTIRRKNYHVLLEAALSLPRCTPLYAHLPPDVFPYVFPVVLTNPEADHPTMRSAGIEILRWENLCASECSVSREFEMKLVQVPCHQDLSIEQLTYLKAELTSILGVSK